MAGFRKLLCHLGNIWVLIGVLVDIALWFDSFRRFCGLSGISGDSDR